MSSPLIIPYQSHWPDDFQTIKEVLMGGLPQAVVIEHIGSTAVEGLAAKPIIDIDIMYDHHNQFNEIRKKLEQLGYDHAGDQGIPGREVFKRKSDQPHKVLDHVTHHLYVCHVESKELKRHLSFRDYLRTHADTKKAYEQLKLEIARKSHQDKKKYAELKEELARDFIETILNV